MEHAAFFNIPMEITYHLKNGEWEILQTNTPPTELLTQFIKCELLTKAVKKRFGNDSKNTPGPMKNSIYIYIDNPYPKLKEYTFTIADDGEYKFELFERF